MFKIQAVLVTGRLVSAICPAKTTSCTSCSQPRELLDKETATAIVSVTVLDPAQDASGLTLFPLQLDMRDKLSEELTIINNTDIAREIRVELTPSTTNATCKLHFSPMRSTLAPHSSHVVRLSFLTSSNRYCTTDHDLLISDMQLPENLLFTVPILTTR